MITLRKKEFVAVVLCAFILISGLAIIYAISANSNPETLTIQGIDSPDIEKPQDGNGEIDLISRELYLIIRSNNVGDIPDNSIKDIVIRDGSYSKTFSESEGVHRVSFIVDIESIHQSYHVKYAWSNSGDDLSENGNYQYDTLVTCLPQDLLIYGIFPCEDNHTIPNGHQLPSIIIGWSDVNDNNEISLSDQLSSDDIDYISKIILSDYSYKNKITDNLIPTSITQVIRTIRSGENTLKFEITVNSKTTYLVAVDYDKEPRITITNNGVNIAS